MATGSSSGSDIPLLWNYPDSGGIPDPVRVFVMLLPTFEVDFIEPIKIGVPLNGCNSDVYGWISTHFIPFDSSLNSLLMAFWVHLDTVNILNAKFRKRATAARNSCSRSQFFVIFRPNASSNPLQPKRRIVEYFKGYRLVSISSKFQSNLHELRIFKGQVLFKSVHFHTEKCAKNEWNSLYSKS